MIASDDRETDFTIIGENIHTTRVVLRRAKRFVAEPGAEALRYHSVAGEPRLLAIPEAVKLTQDYDEGRIKHVRVAVLAAMSDDAAARAEGLAYIAKLAHDQEQAGAGYLDLNVDEISVKPAEQKAAMAWLVETVQGMSALPIAVDSSSVEVIAAGLAAWNPTAGRPMLNSASLERAEALDLALAHDARVIVTAAGEKGMPANDTERVANATRMIDRARAKGIALGDIFVDPLIFPISVDPAFGRHSLDAIRRLREAYGPEIHITGGLSNVSFGIPARRIVNDVFLILAVEAGADSGIIDPVASRLTDVFAIDRDSESYRMAEDVLLGRDPDCRNYIHAWRKKRLAPLRAAG